MSHHDLMLVIKRRRERDQFTQMDMAKAIGVSRRHYVRCESGKAELKLSQFVNAMKFLNITYLDLALDLLNLKPVMACDVAAAARTLSAAARRSLVEFMMKNYHDRKKTN
ncbi:helix-turn-helix domain-containing protein [Vibrio sp. Of14-4]|uniref:helix-turn-helix domain-containing protein n=1 Tax=Vibrio sp. Of14-4 TaxID=2724878 RepID=UPI001EF186EF|nr:helix-turn-helix transcriptional regulator [Vibrio sp. Of14-4]MCG7491566.1 helix-turn-helix domain-containing protein [Vibrio sp. Of14-4]